MVRWAAELFTFLPLKIFFWVIAAIYAVGAIVHIRNILGLSGYAWQTSPMLWRVFDIAFLVLNLAVIAGVLGGKGWAVIAFLAATALQLVLYTMFPSHFAETSEQAAALRGLVFTHLALLAVFGGLLLVYRFR